MPMSEFTRELAKLVTDIRYTSWDDFGHYQVLLVLNACSVQCASVPEVDVPKIIVSVNTLNSREYSSYQEVLQATARLLSCLRDKAWSMAAKDDLNP